MSLWDAPAKPEKPVKETKSKQKPRSTRKRAPRPSRPPVPDAPVMELRAVLNRAWKASTWYVGRPACPDCGSTSFLPSKTSRKCRNCGFEEPWMPSPLWVSLFRVRDYIDKIDHGA